MTKEQMEDAVAEMRYLIDLLERGALEQAVPGKLEQNLRPILLDREAWLRGRVLMSIAGWRRMSAEAIG